MISLVFEIAVTLTTVVAGFVAVYAGGQAADRRKVTEARLTSKSELAAKVAVEDGTGGDVVRAEEPDR